MNDRELLELAAKAANIAGKWVEWQQAVGNYWVNGIDTGFPILWNPLVDDGEALRLAVKLGIHITNSETDSWASTVKVTSIESFNNDPYAATRRAIVRAAAEIGKAMLTVDAEK